MKTSIKALLAGAALALTTGSLFAEELNLSETPESKNINVNLVIPKMAGIAQADKKELKLNQFDGTNSPTDSVDFCIFSNIGSDIKMTVTSADSSDNNGFHLKLQNKADSQENEHASLPFKLEYKNTKNTDVKALKSGSETTVSGAKWVQQCRSDKSGSTLEATVSKQNAEDMYAGTYATVLTVTVNPQ